MSKKKRALTESEWTAVFSARCLSKRGFPLTDEQRDLCTRAHATDAKRYSAMTNDVFNTTVPFGSSARKP